MKTVLKMLLVLLIAISLIGCNPRLLNKVKSDVYLGPERPTDEIATVKGDGHTNYWVYAMTSSLAVIHKVDGEVLKGKGSKWPQWTPPEEERWVYFDADEVRVLPGPHEVAVTIYKLSTGFLGISMRVTGECPLIFYFEAKAGHTYRVDVPFYLKKTSVIQLVDEATKEVIDSRVVEF